MVYRGVRAFPLLLLLLLLLCDLVLEPDVVPWMPSKQLDSNQTLHSPTARQSHYLPELWSGRSL